jgi:hypothetical protein
VIEGQIKNSKPYRQERIHILNGVQRLTHPILSIRAIGSSPLRDIIAPISSSLVVFR